VVEKPGAYRRKTRPHSGVDALVALASRQHGVVSRGQLDELGLTEGEVRTLIDGRRLLRVHRAVYAVGHLALTVDSRRMAAVLACGPGALLSHRAGGALQGLLSSSPQLDVTVRQPRAKRDGIVLHRSRLIHPEDRDVVRGIPVTSVARTLVDLADVLPEERLAKALHEAEIQRTFDLKGVERVLDRLPGRRGRRRLTHVLAAYRPVPGFTRSRAERRFIALCERHGLPRPAMNVWLGEYEVDAYWDDVGVAVEIDGGETHLTWHAFQADRTRDRRLAARGVRVVRVTWTDLLDDARLAAELREVRAAAALGAGSPPAPAYA
jgi:predicted transcriptional regulator of viral defense system